MTTDEKVNGARIAAKILEQMEPKNRERIEVLIKAKDPVIFQAIEESILSLDSLQEFSVQKRERLIQRVDHNDLVTCLQEASKETQEALLEAASEKRREIIEYDLKTLPSPSDEAKQIAREKVVTTIREIDALPDAPLSNPKNIWA